MKLIRKKSQVTLELAVTFIVFCLFILGIINIFVWGNAQVVGRSKNYESDRVQAGSSQPGKWPSYTPSSLEEDEVILSD